MCNPVVVCVVRVLYVWCLFCKFSESDILSSIISSVILHIFDVNPVQLDSVFSE